VREISSKTTAFLAPDEARPLWDKIRTSPCYLAADGPHRGWADFLAALATRDLETVARIGPQLYGAAPENLTQDELTYLVIVTATAELARNAPSQAYQALQQMWSRLDHRGPMKTALLILFATSRAEAQAGPAVASDLTVR
jgi:hypothetical protein